MSVETRSKEVIVEMQNKLEEFKVQRQQFMASSKRTIADIRSINVEEAEMEELDRLSDLMVGVVNSQIEITKKGEKIFNWAKDHGVLAEVSSEDLKDLEACIGASELPLLSTLDDAEGLKIVLDGVEEPKAIKTNKRSSKEVELPTL